VQLVKSILVLLPYNTDQTRVDILKSVLVKNLTSFTANDSSLQDHVTLLAPVKMTKEKSETRAHRSKWHANIPAFFNFNGGLFLEIDNFYFHKNTLYLKLVTNNNFLRKEIARHRKSYYVENGASYDPDLQLHMTLGTCYDPANKQNQKYLHGLKSDTKNIQILKKDLHFFTAHFIKADINGEKFKRYTSSQPKITL
jgi:hypothetical protein